MEMAGGKKWAEEEEEEEDKSISKCCKERDACFHVSPSAMRVFDIPNAPLIDPRSSLSLCPPIQVGSFPLSSSLGIGIAFVPPRNGSFWKRGRFF